MKMSIQASKQTNYCVPCLSTFYMDENRNVGIVQEVLAYNGFAYNGFAYNGFFEDFIPCL